MFLYVSSGCTVGRLSDTITVESCLSHDFNVAEVDQVITSNISTNDNINGTAVYNSTPELISKPVGSVPSLSVGVDGSYTFSSNVSGKYLYNMTVCLSPVVLGCAKTMLEINVVEQVNSQENPVSNLEFGTTYSGQEIVLNGLSNDACVYTGGCSMDSTTLSVVQAAAHGAVSIDANGVIRYTPDADFIGFDTIGYEVCLSDGLTCSSSIQVITVNDSTSRNSTVGADDFSFTLKEETLTGNVLENDMDGEGDGLFVVEVGSPSSLVGVTGGEYYIDSLGNYTFVPNEGFVGYTEIIYTLCDDNVTGACVNATLHLLVFDYMSIDIRVYLEGALMQNGGTTSSTSGLPLMRDDLRVSPYTGENYIPLEDPYTYMKDPFVNTPSKFNRIGPGLLTENLSIVDSTGVFGVQGDNAIVDWVHVELRSKDDMSLPIATRSGLLQRDGDVVDLDGISPLRFQGVNVDSFYVVLKHRSHLGVMSMKVSNEDLIDFTSESFAVFDHGTSQGNGLDYTGLAMKSGVVTGYKALWGGDFDSNGKVKFTNPNDDQNILFVDVLFSSPDFLINYNNAFGYMTGDFNMDSKAKYTNPEDDLNYLFSQVLLYPQNVSFFSNFNGMIEQIPQED